MALTYEELLHMKHTLDTTRDDDRGHHYLPEKYSQDLSKCINLVNRELRALKKVKDLQAIGRAKLGVAK
ncbi:hypothetical protein [Ralstonia phage phiRSL1]|uniref:Uncharacterized protein n=1 Tax=Ralstonia phage phiRSL1 TaxID=1980924 RepID=B2ZXQ6_9CAUD|nr:hypothetical protein RSL1_ORF036 [Ralstonia phage phiRSL1]BAG41481.1 hypothetical protein [Ralstonia phage phiRSL1]